MDDTTCSAAKSTETCQIKIKILKATFFQNCFKEGLKQATEILLKQGLDLKGSYIHYYLLNYVFRNCS